MTPHAIILGYPNRIDQLTLDAVGSWSVNSPAKNVQTRQLAQLARTTNTDAKSFYFKGAFDLPKRVRILSLIKHNLTFTAKLRLRASRNANFTNLVYDSGWVDAWAGVVGSDWNVMQNDWLSDNFWLGSLNREQTEGLTPIAVHVSPGDIFAQHWDFEVSDPNNPAGYLEVGRVFLGEGVQSKRGYSYGAGLGYEDPSVIETTESGSEYYDVKEALRVFRFSLEMMSADEAFGKALEIVRRAGTHGEVFVIADPTDRRHGLRRNFMGRLRQLSALEQMAWLNGEDVHTLAFEIKETR